MFNTRRAIVLLQGYGVKPSAINVGDQTIPVVEMLEDSESGWLYREEKDIIFVKYQHPTGEVNFEVLPPDVDEVEPEQPVDSSNEAEAEPPEPEAEADDTAAEPEQQEGEEPM